MNWHKFFRETDWYVFHKRRRSVFLQAILMGPGIQNSLVPFDHRVRYFGDLCDTILIDQKEKERLVKKTKAQLKKDPMFLLRLMRSAYKRRSAYEEIWKRVSKADGSLLSNKRLAQLLQEYAN